jgi:hypothetical protein
MEEETFYEMMQNLSDGHPRDIDFGYAVRLVLYDEKQRLRCKRLSEIMERAQNRLGIAMQLKGNAMDKAITEIDSVLNSLTAARHLMAEIERKREVRSKIHTSQDIWKEA